MLPNQGNFKIAHTEIALRLDVLRVRLREPLSDFKILLVELQRLLRLAQLQRHIAEFAVANTVPALRLDVRDVEALPEAEADRLLTGEASGNLLEGAVADESSVATRP